MRQVMVKGTEPTYWVPAATSRGILKDKAEYSAFNAVCRRLREDVTDLRTDGRTDGQTDGWTDPLIEMQGHI